jgi:hypothetical protein
MMKMIINFCVSTPNKFVGMSEPVPPQFENVCTRMYKNQHAFYYTRIPNNKGKLEIRDAVNISILARIIDRDYEAIHTALAELFEEYKNWNMKN